MALYAFVITIFFVVFVCVMLLLLLLLLLFLLVEETDVPFSSAYSVMNVVIYSWWVLSLCVTWCVCVCVCMCACVQDNKYVRSAVAIELPDYPPVPGVIRAEVSLCVFVHSDM